MISDQNKDVKACHIYETEYVRRDGNLKLGNEPTIRLFYSISRALHSDVPK